MMVWIGMVLASGRAPAMAQAETAAAGSTNAALRQISADVFELGRVRLDKARKTVEFPAQLNMNAGLIEYLLVNVKGKTYESLLRTDTEPYQIQLAMLLIGASGAPRTPALLAAASAPFHVNRPPGAANAPPLVPEGDRISIELVWRVSGQERRARAEDWVFNLATKTNAARGSWVYNGSRIVNGVFIAQRDGSIVAMIDDIDAMVNNPRSGHDNDQIWQINTNDLPPLETAVEVTFRLENSSK